MDFHYIIDNDLFSISSVCFESYPCKHNVFSKSSGKTVLMSGRKMLE